jgi:hypothetical protein
LPAPIVGSVVGVGPQALTPQADGGSVAALSWLWPGAVANEDEEKGGDSVAGGEGLVEAELSPLPSGCLDDDKLMAWLGGED